MKKNRIKTLLTTALLSLCASVSAYDFTVDGLYYNIVSLEDLTCEITYNYNGDIHSGHFVIPEKVTYNNKTLTVVGINSNAFYKCSELSSITIPNTVTYIDSGAFRNCKAITSIIIPSSVTYIGVWTFEGCESLNNIVFEDGNETLEWENINPSSYEVYSIFYDCPIDSLYIGRNFKREYDNWWYGLFEDSSVKKLTIGNTVTKIESSSFSGCKNMTEVSFGDSVTTIGSNSFSGCDNLTEVSLGNSVTMIGSGAFDNCRKLTEISLGKSVANISSFALSGCENLTTIYSFNPTPPTFTYGYADFTNKQYINVNVYVPKGSLAAYQTADVWKNFWNIQEYSPETGIESITVDNGQKNRVYDLQGRKLETPQHGINIINGKKVLIK